MTSSTVGRGVAPHGNDASSWLLAEEPDSGIFEALDRAHPLAEAFDSSFRKRIEFLSSAGIVICATAGSC